MSFDREQETDRRQTERVMRGERPLTDSTDNRRNWLGHKIGDGTARLDKMMLRGATIKEMEKVRGAVKEHLRHYERIHRATAHGSIALRPTKQHQVAFLTKAKATNNNLLCVTVFS